MADNDKLVTKQGLRDFYNQIRPYLNGGANIGYTPIGTIISLMGKTAPKHYLKCDGTIYNIVDYQELADYFEDEFGTNNYFGGNGTTTFAVPDLRGEFLRGTGTNSHANQGNGSDVGVHQNATQHINFTTGSGNLNYGTVSVTNADKTLSSGARNYLSKTGAAGSEAVRYYTARPTNTSVLYCIATKDIYIDARYDYSTAEKAIGTWIDGKPLYQKTIIVDLSSASKPSTDRTWITLTPLPADVDFCMIDEGNSFLKNGNTTLDISPVTFYTNTNQYLMSRCYAGNIQLLSQGQNIYYTACGNAGSQFVFTLKYTKTTDT